MCRNPQWPGALLLLLIMNQMIANRLREIPQMKANEMTREKSRLVKILTEITACYVQVAQVIMMGGCEDRVFGIASWEKHRKKKNRCIWQFQEWKRRFVVVCVRMDILSQIVLIFGMIQI